MNDLKDLILSINDIDCELAAIDGTGHTIDYAGQYYAKYVENPGKATLKTILQLMLTQD